jgi:hypothetical protein
LALTARDHGARVLAGAHDDHAAGDLAFAVQFRDAAAHLGADLDGRRRRRAHGHAAGCRFSGTREIVERLRR